jgi:hypothetical protein
MRFWTSDNKLESKDNFHDKIEKYYFDIAGNKIPKNLLIELVDKLTNTQYDNYKRFWDQYPKSRKRYSELKIDDLEHPFTHYKISDFFKNRDIKNYKAYSMILLRMTEKEFSDYETRKYQYETK